MNEPSSLGVVLEENLMYTAPLPFRTRSTLPNARRTSPIINRPIVKKLASNEERDYSPSRKTKEAQERFILKIDGQAKRSFANKESAINAATAIKQKFPIVKAAVFDSLEGGTEAC